MDSNEDPAQQKIIKKKKKWDRKTKDGWFMRIMGKSHVRKLSGDEETTEEGEHQLRGQDPRWERWGASHMEACGQARLLPAYNLCMESFPEALGSWERHFLAL